MICEIAGRSTISRLGEPRTNRDGGLRAPFVDLVKPGEPVHSGHSVVENDEVEISTTRQSFADLLKVRRLDARNIRRRPREIAGNCLAHK